MNATRVAVLGTGKMGSAIAARLAEAGFEVVLWNSLTGPDAVQAVYLGPEGALSAGHGKTFIEMSTAGPDVVPVLATHIAAAGGRFVDAPIMGAPPLRRAGQATILAGGTAEDVDTAAAVVGAFGTVRHVGGTGCAARLKLIANSMLADVILAAAELQVAGEDAGLDPDDVFWVLERAAPGLESRRAGLVEGRHAPPQFALRDLHKDVDFALALFGSANAQTPMLRWTSERVSSVAATTPDLDISAVARLYRSAPEPGHPPA